LTPEEGGNPNKLACLFGFPNFEAPLEQRGLAASRTANRGVGRAYVLKLNPAAISLSSLPGTQVEVERIGNLLRRNGWEVQMHMQDKAQEETLKESNRPRLLHIATHGYFQSESSTSANPLLQSGLFLSGSANTLNGNTTNVSEDGILTAYEAMNLNLDNTDLVVLSACETGLGEIKNGEGVYGLQRAFKVAGAKTLIMSLWKVDDQATQELMVAFYKHWLGEAAPGSPNPTRQTTKRAAFLKAQKELKAKYPNPYYWGPFVLVGE
jgi:CHAT domain-containing protein